MFIVLKAFDTTLSGEKATILAGIVKECQQIAQDLYGVVIYSVITDNATNMVSMGELI